LTHDLNFKPLFSEIAVFAIWNVAGEILNMDKQMSNQDIYIHLNFSVFMKPCSTTDTNLFDFCFAPQCEGQHQSSSFSFWNESQQNK